MITVKEDFEKAYNILNQREYPLSFYEYSLKHEIHSYNHNKYKLIGVFENDECLGTISYQVADCSHLGKILEVKEIYQTSIRGYKALMDYLDKLAKEEDCHAIKICKNTPERLNNNLFDRLESFLKNLIQ